jgi:hypothetical protein
MIVKCIRNKIDDTLEAEIGLPKGEGPRNFSRITVGKEYVVLALAHFLDSEFYYGQYPVLDIKDDIGTLSSLPLFLFEVIDDRPSKYWHFNYNRERKACEMAPKSFYQEFYHDDLSEGYPEIEADFQRVSELLENETYKYEIGHLKFKDFTNLKQDNLLEGIRIENPWVQCPKCAETSKTDCKDLTYKCKQCKSIVINPYYNKVVE